MAVLEAASHTLQRLASSDLKESNSELVTNGNEDLKSLGLRLSEDLHGAGQSEA